jgi:hypothetical protein
MSDAAGAEVKMIDGETYTEVIVPIFITAEMTQRTQERVPWATAIQVHEALSKASRTLVGTRQERASGMVDFAVGALRSEGARVPINTAYPYGERRLDAALPGHVIDALVDSGYTFPPPREPRPQVVAEPPPPSRAPKQPRECANRDCSTILTLATAVDCYFCHTRFCAQHCTPACPDLGCCRHRYVCSSECRLRMGLSCHH